MKKFQLILVGPSASGKSSIQRWLLENAGFVKPVNFTTREPRNDSELDEYVFLDVDQFVKKLRRGHFIEHTVYNKNFYGITKFLDLDKHNCIVADPIGLAQLQKHFRLENVPFATGYVEVSPEVQDKRLQERRLNWHEVKARKDDLKWFPFATYSFTVDGEGSIQGEASRIAGLIKDAQSEIESKLS